MCDAPLAAPSQPAPTRRTHTSCGLFSLHSHTCQRATRACVRLGRSLTLFRDGDDGDDGGGACGGAVVGGFVQGGFRCVWFHRPPCGTRDAVADGSSPQTGPPHRPLKSLVELKSASATGALRGTTNLLLSLGLSRRRARASGNLPLVLGCSLSLSLSFLSSRLASSLQGGGAHFPCLRKALCDHKRKKRRGARFSLLGLSSSFVLRQGLFSCQPPRKPPRNYSSNHPDCASRGAPSL